MPFIYFPLGRLTSPTSVELDHYDFAFPILYYASCFFIIVVHVLPAIFTDIYVRKDIYGFINATNDYKHHN